MWSLWGLVGFFLFPLQCYYNAFLCNRLWMCIWDPRDCWVLLILSGHHSWLMPQLLIHKHVAALPKELRIVNSPLIQVCTSRLVPFQICRGFFFSKWKLQNQSAQCKVTAHSSGHVSIQSAVDGLSLCGWHLQGYWLYSSFLHYLQKHCCGFFPLQSHGTGCGWCRKDWGRTTSPSVAGCSCVRWCGWSSGCNTHIYGEEALKS